jgi:flagellar M-ring protein FliF
MKKLLANLSLAQRITIGAVVALVAAGMFGLVHWRREANFRPLFTGLAPEDAAGIVQKLKEGGVEYRLPENGGTVLVPAERVAEVRLSLAAAGLPKTGRIGFELFDKTNLGATEFTEHVNFRRALEGELERSVMSLAEVEQARVHLTFSKDSVFVESQQPAKASVLVKIRPGARLSPQNVQAIDHLVASAVEGLAPESVSVLDMNGNLLGRPRAAETLDGPGPSEGALEYRHKIEADLLAKINATLEPVLGAEKFRAGVSVECDFTGAEQSEEIFDPARSVMVTSQRTEDASATGAAGGVPGTASSLPRPTSRPASGAGRVTRTTENIAYQTSRTVKKTRLPAGAVRKVSLAVLVDQALTWHRTKTGYDRVLVPPSPEKLKVIRDLVAGVAGINPDRGDQIVVETLPFENTLLLEPPALPPTEAPRPPARFLSFPLPNWDRKTQTVAAGAALLAVLAAGAALTLLRKRGKVPAPQVPLELPGQPAAAPGSENSLTAEAQLESQLAEREAQQRKMEAQTLSKLSLAPPINKAAEILAKHLRDKVSKEPEMAAQILRTWIHEDDN